MINFSKKIFSLDFGTTKFCIASLNNESLGKYKLDTISVPSLGMRRGMVIDMEGAQKALTQLIEEAENELNSDIEKVAIGIAGSHLESSYKKYETLIHKNPITQQDLKKFNDDFILKNRIEKREILHAIPIDYQIDEREKIKNPLGFTGTKISIHFFVIEACKNYVKDVVSLCNSCGLKVSHIFSEPYASACVSISQELKNIGVAIIDIGGGTSDGLIFSHGNPTKLFNINIGGTSITNDISMVLGIPYIEAEKLKLNWGLSKPTKNEGQLIEVTNIHNKKIVVQREVLLKILSSRVIELCKHIKKELEKDKEQIGAGLLVTGGGSEISNLIPFMNEYLKIPIKKVNPNPNFFLPQTSEMSDLENQQISPIYATATGLLYLQKSQQDLEKVENQGLLRKHINNFFHWIKELS